MKHTKQKVSLRFKQKMLIVKNALKQEKTETLQMLSIYRNFTLRRGTTKEELKIAHEQFFDILKGTGLGVFAILPLAPITIPLLLKLGKMAGVDLLPTSFTSPKIDEKIILDAISDKEQKIKENTDDTN